MSKKFMGFLRPIFKGGDMENRLTFFVPINKFDEDQRMVYGIATCETLDKQNEIVDYNATKEALSDYSDWRNIREMHRPSAVGVAPVLELRDNDKTLFIGAKIVDDAAWEKCKEGVYKGFSIGGEVLDRRVEVNKSTGRPINRVTKYVMNEISVVDRPANPSCKFQTVKRDTTIETVTVTEDPLKLETERVMEKVVTLAKRILSKEDLENLPDESFGLIKIVSDGDKLVKHRQYPMPDKVHAINMIRKMAGADELSSTDKERIHQTALLVLGKKHNETECPYCIKQKLEGGVQVEKTEVKKAVVVTHEPDKTLGVKVDAPVTEAPVKPAVAAPVVKPEVVVDDEAVVADPINTKLDRVISLLEELVGSGEELPAGEELAYDEEVKAEDDDEDEESKSDAKPAEEEEDDEAKVKVKPAEEEEEDDEAKVKVKPAEEEEEEDDESKVKVKPADEADECNKVVKSAKVKTVVKKGLLNKIRAIVEPLAKENKILRAKIEKLEKQPLPRKEAKAGDKPVKVEKYQDAKLEKKETDFSEELTKDISKATDLRKSGKILTKEEDSFCQRVAERMLAEKLSK